MVSVAIVKIRKRDILSGGKKYKSAYITIPSEFLNDSAFPFKEEDLIVMRIEGDKVVLAKFQESKE
ncbi:MAG: hypothetical protein QXS54_11090 [Candidatus Methanomethylicaceae archaeon]